MIASEYSLRILSIENKKYEIKQTINEERGIRKILKYDNLSFFLIEKSICIFWKIKNNEYYKCREYKFDYTLDCQNAILTNFNEICMIGYMGIDFLNIYSNEYNRIYSSYNYMNNQNILLLKNNYILASVDYIH